MHFVLDVNETLSDMSPLEGVLTAHGAPAGTASAWFAGVLRDGFALSIQRQAPAFADLARQGLASVLHSCGGLDASAETITEEVLAAFGSLDLHPDVAPGLRELHAAGHRLSTLTNGAVANTRALLERAGLTDVVTTLLSVEEQAVWKPHPDAYAVGARSLGSDPGDLTLVAVHPWDLDGASRAGLRTVWVNRGGGPWPEAFTRPDHEVAGITEIAGHFESPSGGEV